MPFPLETQHLVLLPMAESDDEEFLDIYVDPDSMRYIEPGRSREKSAGRLRWLREQFDAVGFGHLVARERGESAIVGGGMLMIRNPGDPIELGYIVAKKHWGKGYATEIAAAIVRWAFGELQIPRIVAQVHPDNAPSARVLLKIGFRRDLAPKAKTDTQWYEILRNR